MTMHRGIIRAASAILLGALALTAVAAPVAQADDPAPCRVSNVTQDTAGRSFRRMVRATVDGDRLSVSGTCLARRVVIGADITIRGVGDHRAVLDARGRRSVLRVGEGTVVTLRHLVITGGAGTHGRGIQNLGTLTLTDSVVRNNRGAGLSNYLFFGKDGHATLTVVDSIIRDNRGGGISNDGWLLLVGSVVRGNRADAGGGISEQSMFDPSAALVDSVIRGNRARIGGGIYSSGAFGTLTLTNSVVRGNTATENGGGIHNWGPTVTLLDSVVRGNRAGEDGGGILIAEGDGTLILKSSVVRGNTAGDQGGGIYTDRGGIVRLRLGSSVTGNTPDDCHGTTAC